jgi:hypothetical protein
VESGSGLLSFVFERSRNLTTTARTINKAFIVRFFADGNFRVEGPFVPAQVQRLIDTDECHVCLRHWAHFAMWGKDPTVDAGELFVLSPEINEIASRLAHKRYQPLLANHYRAQHRKHWEEKT